jgi:hypothetical protein
LSAVNVVPALSFALHRLWRDSSENLFDDPGFVAFRTTCQEFYPQATNGSTLNLSLSTALRNLGWSNGGPPPNLAPEEAAARIDAALRQTSSCRTHLCPLDLGDGVPELAFGPNSIRTFAAEELANIIDPDWLARAEPGWMPNITRLSQFAWLVVPEVVELPPEVGARTLPILYEKLDHDVRAIIPHKPKFPDAVEAALFALLLVAWEDMVAYADYYWRPFRVPWVHTVNDDLFVSRPPVPDADTLTWEPYRYQNASGEEGEDKRPTRLQLKKNAVAVAGYLNDQLWASTLSACRSPLCKRPFRHFLVRAFVNEGVDEFLSHITTIEAALGSPQDRESKPRLPGKRQGATDRLSWRITGLLKDDAAGKRYRQLFADRSAFLHGREMGVISSASRLDARRIARRCVSALIEAAQQDSKDPDAFRHHLVLQGMQLDKDLQSTMSQKTRVR